MSEKVKLGELAEIVSGSTPKTNIKEYWDGNVLWITPAEIKENEYYIADTQRKITSLAVEKTNLRILPKGTVLLSSRAPIGKVAICDNDMYCNQGFKNIICSEKLNNRYVYYYLKYNVEYIKSLGRGATFKEISKGIVENLEIPFRDKEEQIAIANKLDKITEIIKIRKEQVKHFDEIIKSQFVEMFENKNFELKTLNEVSIIKGEYGSGASAGEFVEGQPRYVRITDIQEDGRLSNQSIASPKNEENIDKYILQYGDVLFARTGATVGKTYKYNEKDGYCIYAGYCIRFRLDLKICNPDYIFIYTKTDNYKKWVENKQRVVAQPNINAKEYGNDLRIPIPPIELQNKFADFVKQIDKQKFEIENSLKEMQELYESLMEKYFG